MYLPSALFTLLLIVPLVSCESSLVVRTHTGPIKGVQNGATRVWLGIPYAQPPVGNLRWRAPQEHKGWSNTLEATAVGSHCPQSLMFPIFPPSNVTFSEDCLTLNIWSPKDSEKLLPVMVWIHGGGFVFGGSADADFVYDGTTLSRHGVVVVSINYRLGVFGFLALEQLSKEDSTHPVSGSYGLEDQRAALQWVQKNVHLFGGDPQQVTIFGESAGAASVAYHLISPPSKSLFKRAILQSAHSVAYPHPTLAEAHKKGEQVVKPLGCAGSLSCLRSKSVDEIFAVVPPMHRKLFWHVAPYLENAPTLPVVDGVNLKEQPAVAFNKGDFNSVDVLVGANLNDGDIMVKMMYPFGMARTESFFTSFMESAWGEKTPAVLAAYPITEYKLRYGPVHRDSVRRIATDLITHGNFYYSAHIIAKAFAKQGANTYFYSFEHAPDIRLYLTVFGEGEWGAYHAGEIPGLFGNYPHKPGHPASADDKHVGSLMQVYWTNFAKSGNPNVGAEVSVEWPSYTVEGAQYLAINKKPTVSDHVLKEQLAFWETTFPNGLDARTENELFWDPALLKGLNMFAPLLYVYLGDRAILIVSLALLGAFAVAILPFVLGGKKKKKPE